MLNNLPIIFYLFKKVKIFETYSAKHNITKKIIIIISNLNNL